MSKNFTVHSPFGLLNVEYIDDDESIALQTIAELSKEKVIGYDVETTYREEWFGDKMAGLDPHRSRLRLVQFACTDRRVFIFDFFSASPAVKEGLLNLLEKPLPVKVAHNAKFDVKFAKYFLNVRKFGRLCCTELLSRLVTCGQKKIRISLKNSIFERLGITLEKEEQLSDWSRPILEQSQLEYAAIDAFAVLPLREDLIKDVRRLEIERAAVIDFDTVDVVAGMELKGFPIDPELWIANDELMKERRLDVIDEIYNEFRSTGVVPQQGLFASAPLGGSKKKDQIKINSPKTLQWLLELYGVEIPEKKDKVSGKVSKTTDTPNLKPLAKHYKVLPLLLLFRELDKRKSSYGAKYIEKYVNPATGRIHADYDPLATKTGRFACASPNLQQIPHIVEYRSCFVAPEGKKFVSADYSQIELRVAAELTGDEGFIKAFQSGADFHDATTALMFHLEMPPEDKKERKDWDKTEEGLHFKEMRGFAKRINFGIIYGMGAYALSMQTGLDANKDELRKRLIREKDDNDAFSEDWLEETVAKTDTAQDYIDKYCERFATLMVGLDAWGKDAAKFGEIRTWIGRLAKFSIDRKLKGSIAKAERNGKNTPVQGGAGEILKIALRLIYDAIYNAEVAGMIPVGSVTMVNIIHDEIILEVNDEPFTLNWARTILEKAMKESGELILKQVPCKVDADITTEWKK
jgi:DNA polymerase I-like protein with 3'-5' exonuclease and polymerase domains